MKLKYGQSIILDFDFDIDSIKDIKEVEQESNYELLNKEDFKEADKYLFKLTEDDEFSLLHKSLVKDIKFLIIPKNKEVNVNIKTLVKGNSFNHLVIIAKENSKVDVIEDISSNLDERHYRSKIVEIFVYENAKVNYGEIQNLSNSCYNFVFKKAVTKDNAEINWLDCFLGSKFTKATTIAKLTGKGSQTRNYGLFLGDKEQQFDLSAASLHLNEYTFSDMVTKGVLKDKSRAVYNGLVKIGRNAPYSNGYQQEHTLLLGEEAEADAIPRLEIDNSEVKCSHGATIGRVDKDKLFYLMSRGLDEDLATKKIVEGFFHPMIEKIPLEDLRESIHSIILERLEK